MIYYPQAQPDFYDKKFTLTSYENVFKTLDQYNPSKHCLYLNERGLATTHKIHYYLQKIKGWFGFENLADEKKIDAELLKFLHYGLIHQYITHQSIRPIIESVYGKIKINQLKVNELVEKSLSDLSHQNETSKAKHQDLLNNLRLRLTSYCQVHQNNLRPSFWNRLFSDTLPSGSYSASGIFGETYLALAEQQVRQAWRENYHISNNTLKCFKHAASRHSSLSDAFSKRLIQSFQGAEGYITDPACNHQVSKINLRLGQRESLRDKQKEAAQLFQKVYKKNFAMFNAKHLILWLQSEISIKGVNFIEILVRELDKSGVSDPKSKNIYINGCLELGDHYFRQSQTLKTRLSDTITGLLTWKTAPSQTNYLSLAFSVYHKAFDKADSEETRQLILNKLIVNSKAVSPDLLKTLIEKEYLNSDSPTYEQGWSCAIYLMMIQCHTTIELLKKKGHALINKFLKTTINCKKEGLAPQAALGFINEVIPRIDIIGNGLVALKEALISSHPYIESDIADLISKERFTVDVGANLYFLKGELLSETKGSPEAIYEAYKKASELAPKNPFGVGGLFMEDDQISPEDDFQELIKNYRKFALDWGAAETLKSLGYLEHSTN